MEAYRRGVTHAPQRDNCLVMRISQFPENLVKRAETEGKAIQLFVARFVADSLTGDDSLVFRLICQRGRVLTRDVTEHTGIYNQRAMGILRRLERLGLVVDDGEGEGRNRIWLLSMPWSHMEPTGEKDPDFIRAFRMGPRKLGQWWEARWFDYKAKRVSRPPPWPHDVFPQLVNHDYGFFEAAFPSRSQEFKRFIEQWQEKSRTFEV